MQWNSIHDHYEFTTRSKFLNNPRSGPLNYASGPLLGLLLKSMLNDIALPDKSSQSYELSLAIWDHTVLPATRHKWTRPPNRNQTGWFTYPGGWKAELLELPKGINTKIPKCRINKYDNSNTIAKVLVLFVDRLWTLRERLQRNLSRVVSPSFARRRHCCHRRSVAARQVAARLNGESFSGL